MELADGALWLGQRVLVGIGVVMEIAALGGHRVLANRPVQALLTV